MLEFVFFDPRPQREFVAYLQRRGLAVTTLKEQETYGVAIPEEIDDALLDEIEGHYEELMALDQSLFEADEGTAGEHTAGVVLNLASGETVYAQVDPVLLGRVMEVLTPAELGCLVNAIVDAVENPDARTLCQRPG